MTRRFAPIALLTALMLAAASPARAAEDYLKLAPEGAMAIFAVNDLTALDAKLQAFGRQIQLHMPGILALLEQEDLRKGLDEKGTVALVVLPPENENSPPAPLVLIPVADFDKFIELFEPEQMRDEPVSEIFALRTTFYVRHIGGYAAITDAAHREILFEKNLKLSKEVPAALAAWRQWLAGHDAAGVILPPGIKFISSNVQNGLRQMQSAIINNEQVKSMAAIFDVYASILQTAEREVAGYGFAADLDKQNNIVLSDRLVLVPGGKWAGFVKDARPVRTNLLAGMPEGPFAVAGGLALSEEMSPALMKFSMNMMKNMRGIYGLSDEQVDKMSELSQDWMKGIRSMSMLFQAGQSDEPLYAGALLLMRVDDSRQYLALYREQLRRYTEFLESLHNPMFQPIEVENVEVSGAAGVRLSMKMPQLPENAQSPQGEKMLKLLFGPEGNMNAWIVPLDEHTVAAGYVNTRLLQQAIEAYKQGKPGLAGMSEVKQTAALLPPDAAAVGYFSPTGLLGLIKQVVPAMAPPGANPQFPELPPMPPIGFSITTARNEIQSRMVVPGEAIQAVVFAWLKSRAAVQPPISPVEQ